MFSRSLKSCIPPQPVFLWSRAVVYHRFQTGKIKLPEKDRTLVGVHVRNLLLNSWNCRNSNSFSAFFRASLVVLGASLGVPGVSLVVLGGSLGVPGASLGVLGAILGAVVLASFC